MSLLLGIALLGGLIYLGVIIFPFTPWATPMVRGARPRKGEATLSIMVSNVLQTNTGYGRLAQLIRERDPDILLLVETDEQWMLGIAEVVAHFPERIELPQSNTYGMLFYSKLKIEKYQVEHLVDPEIPSICADLSWGGGTVRIHCIHPTPPVPQENDGSADRDAEVLITGVKVKEFTGLCIVCGDLNDVAWSNTTKLFLKTSGLLDPRRGRGLFSTFHAQVPGMRWPLDHFFVSAHFRAVGMRLERAIGSDHFPISIELLARSVDDNQAEELGAEDAKKVSEKVKEGGNS